MKHGASVMVATDQGRDAGTVIGVQTGWVRVKFADGTNSAWPVAKVTVV